MQLRILLATIVLLAGCAQSRSLFDRAMRPHTASQDAEIVSQDAEASETSDVDSVVVAAWEDSIRQAASLAQATAERQPAADDNAGLPDQQHGATAPGLSPNAAQAAAEQDAAGQGTTEQDATEQDATEQGTTEQAAEYPPPDSAQDDGQDAPPPAADAAQPLIPPVVEPEPVPAPQLPGMVEEDELIGLNLDLVIDSVYRSYPLLEAAVQQRGIATGEQLAATGNFDLGLVAASENGPTGFYRTFRQRIGVVQPVYSGGEVFAGYRIGRGNFEPWYKERETNNGGEFHIGFSAPLAQNRNIDPRRAELWKANFGRQSADPEINAQLIGFVQEAAYAYWTWVAEGENYRIAQRILDFAEQRNEGIRRQREEGRMSQFDLNDNLRMVAERRAARASAQRRVRQAAVKLSLYYRNTDGRPRVPGPEILGRFPQPERIDPEMLGRDISEALSQRPEIAVLSFVQRQLEVDFAQARNEFQPNLDAVVAASQDVGRPTSPLNDKGQFELDAALFFDVPVQRRRARGKMLATQAKLARIGAQRQMVEERIVADVQAAHAALTATYEQVMETAEAAELADDLARREQRNFALGRADLLTVAMREQFAAEAALHAIEALQMYYTAEADYRAALAIDQLP